MTDMVIWMIQCGIVAAVMTVAALVWEAGARWSGRPARWGWFIAMAGSVTLPFLLRLLPVAPLRDAMPAVGVVRLDVLTAAPAAVAPVPLIDAMTIGVALWALLSLAMIAYAAMLLVRLAAARRSWRETRLGDEVVLVSRNLGPAAVGVRRGLVVVPAWALQLDGELQRLMLLHEREHVRAGDPRLLLGAIGLLAVMPWHPLVWFQLLRLRNAIELDCDARVLRQGVSPARYGALLLEIGQRRGGSPLVLATLAEPRMFLERRIRRIAAWPMRRSPVRAVVLSIIALALFSSALLARVRVETALTQEATVRELLGVAPPAVTMPAPMAVDTPPPTTRLQPRQTPYTVAPRLRDADQVMRRMTERYPPLLRDAGIGGTTALWLLIDERGGVIETQVAKSSGYPALDDAAAQVAKSTAFRPAQLEGRDVPAWIEVPFSFGIASSVTVNDQPTVQPKTANAAASSVADKPTFTPMTQRPELINQADVQRALVQNYPPLMRDAGVGGTAVVWFFIDETGRVMKLQLSKSSGYPALDEAAMRVGSTMQFTAARNRDAVVPVWVEIPILFTAKEPQAQAAVRESGARDAVAVARGRESGEQRAATAVPAPAQPAVNAPASAERRQSLEIPAPPQEHVEISAKPTFTPMTVRPELLNQAEVSRALIANYPPLLRDAGIGGTAVVWCFIDEQGTVQKVQLSKSSGYPALDQAAMQVATTMQFTPAGNRDKVVPVWVEIPILFTAK